MNKLARACVCVGTFDEESLGQLVDVHVPWKQCKIKNVVKQQDKKSVWLKGNN